MYRFIAACVVAALGAVGVHAQEGAPAFTLSRALELAGAGSPLGQAGAAQVRAAEAARSVAGLRPNPSVTVQTENVAGSGAYRSFHSAETTAQITIPLEMGGKRSARIAVADARHERALVERSVIAADLTLSVTQAYVAALAAERRAQITGRQVEIALAAHHASQVRVRAGRASPLEEQRGALMLVNARSAAEQAGRLAQVARENLARQIAAPVDAPLDVDWLDRLAVAGPVDRPLIENLLAVRAVELDVATADAQIRLAATQRTPDLQIFVGPRRLEATRDTALTFGVTIPLQVFDRGSAALAQARAEREKADAESRIAKIRISQAVASADAEVANAETAARITGGPALDAAMEAARIARIGYREGKFGQLDLLDAERGLAETRLAAINAQAAYHDATARRDRLTASAPLPLEE
ncbi:TolC family protein [Novosphingobium sp. AP12]|uniref:TolC family protein n=1 Tax=Novosphingobium sp. AP12 TaxID=1144305 RepID=UPI000271F1AE|nr:TolC family protein [Novosphingobium sp. AP12]EJL24221.1 outer membrane protein [Novosphingobium sp. AP12]